MNTPPIPFGNYLLLERVNVGGMAEVFKAKAFGVEGFERLVAVKRILPSIAEDTEFITMFIDEAKIAVQLSHANIVQIFDLGKVNESYFIAMEYVPGKDLRAIFDRARKRREKLPVPLSVYAVMKICEGLDYAHNKKDASGENLHLIHRDVSPQNMLISYDGDVKIADFGVAKAAGKVGKTQSGILKGKFGYMSPEQVRGLPIDKRSDIFALGIVLYELLTGERLFIGETDFSTLAKVRNVDIIPPSARNPNIPEELERIVLKALAKEIEDRYASAMDLHDDLQSFMYTSGNFFARKDLASFMKSTFSEEIAKERERDEQYRRIDPPAGLGTPSSPALRASKSPLSVPSLTPQEPVSASPRGANAIPALPAASLSVSWDDENVQTQLYDKPEEAAPPLLPHIPDSTPPVNLASPKTVSAIRLPTPAPLPRLNQTFGSNVGPIPSLSAVKAIGAKSPNFPASAIPLPRAPFDTAKIPRNDVTEVSGRNLALLKWGGVAVAALLLAMGGYTLFGNRKGSIQLVTEPIDVIVTVDRQPITSGTSPFVIADLEVGKAHEITVTKPGYESWSMPIEPKPGQTVTVGPIKLRSTDLGGAAWAPSANSAEPGATGFSLSTEPSGADVYIDGRRLLQRTPVRVTQIEPGGHSIRVEYGADREPWETNIQLISGRFIELPHVVLSQRRARVSIRSVPDSADVILVRGNERKKVGSTPVSTEVETSGGAWVVEIRKENYRTFVQPLIVSTSGITEITATLESSPDERPSRSASGPSHKRGREKAQAPRQRPAPSEPAAVAELPAGGGQAADAGPGTLRINTQPWTQVYVDGTLIGNTPQMSIPVEPGNHRIMLLNPEFGINRSLNVTVNSGQVVTKILNLQAP